ncbi:DUF885 domain-containing protein [Wenzhouxiangella sp. AB-CW3]|uniref:DUF885 domain-containing protein n=1 Tax=Wenzhouxiangella sp. AB-CW3 TaxID=2771012 RepID=UPI00168BF6A3|nr:DUF885 domain-containing protein [Wenzhouxiangella sp. AB-CW3]QOC22364.1 DUF885 domain-containing protein [Wenzhouxiangella sp. AB-CW3]
MANAIRILAVLALLALLAGCGGESERETRDSEVPADEAVSESLHDFFERIETERAELSPQTKAAAVAGTEREADYLGRLDIPSIERSEAELAMARRHRDELARFDRDSLEGQDALSWDIMAWQLDQRITGADYLWHDFPINQLMAVHNQLPAFMTDQHPLRGDEDVDFYIQRIQQFPEVFQGAIEVVAYRAEQDLYPPRFALEKTARDARQFVAGDAADNPLVDRFIARADHAGVLSDERRAGLEDELARAVREYVVPAYEVFADYLEGLIEQADSNNGIWRLPDGEGYYRWLLKGHTTTTKSAEEIHDLGLAEVERLEGKMHEILCKQDRCDGTVGERMAELNADDRFLFEDSDAGREEILQAYREMAETAEQALDGWFHDGPTAGLEVRRVPEYREDTAFRAYYMRPAADGSRPGVFFANLRSVEEHPRFAMPTLTHHEAVPGHHLQISRMQAMDDVPSFRRTLGLHAHAEGWALYAEYLSAEMGLLDDPYDDLGRLQAELFRAVRLVVDTGMHHHRWSRERGIEYMLETTGMPRSDVVAEIERYLVIPGQACAFKIGMMRIQAMRERAADALGEAFDIRDFHRVILDNGAMPLDLLDGVVDQWIGAGGGPDWVLDSE